MATPNLNITLPTVGGSTDSWGDELNTGITVIDDIFAIGGTDLTMSDIKFNSVGLQETGSGTDTVKIQAPAAVTQYTLTMPDAVGADKQYLRTDGTDGVLEWVTDQEGDITAIVAGAGLTGTDLSGPIPTLNVIGTADKITVSADAVTIAATYVGQTSITTLGTIATGTWEGDTVAVDQGGTGVTSKTGSGSVVLSTSPTLVTPALGTPASGTATNITGLPIVAGTTGTLTVARGGTGATSLTDGGVLFGSGTGAISASAVLGDGEILIGDASGDPATLDVGSSSAITILGTVATGTWNGSVIQATYGGSGLVGATDGTIAIADGSGAPTTLDVGSSTAITILGTVATGVWNGTSIGTGYTDAKVTSVVAGTLIDVSGTTGDVTVNTDLSELATSTSDGDGDFFAVVDAANAQKKLTKANIDISGFNDAVATSITGTGALNAGSITSGFGAINNGASDITTTGTVSATTLTGTLSTAAQTNITSVGTLTSLALSGNLDMEDDDKILLGDSDDLEIYHDGSNSYIKDTGSGDLIVEATTFRPRTDHWIVSNAANTENMLQAVANGACTLYYDANAKLATASGGVDITGTLSTTGFITQTANNDGIRLIGTSDGSQNGLYWRDDAGTDNGRILYRDPYSGGTSIQDRMDFWTSNSHNMTLDQYGTLLVGDTANANMTIGLTINQAANDNQIFALKSSDVSTGITSATIHQDVEVDDFLTISKTSATAGGTVIQSLMEDTGGEYINLELAAYGGTADTTKSTSARALVEVYAAETDGSNALANITANGNVFGVRARVGGANVARWFVDEDGDTWQAGDITIPATSKIYLDGGGDTYIHEAGGNFIEVVAGGTANCRFHATSLEMQGTRNLIVNGTGRVYLDGGSDTYIVESSSNTMDFHTSAKAMSIDGNQNVTITGPSLTIGDGTAEDTKIVFDGNAVDFYMGLDDTDDDFKIGVGSTVGSGEIGFFMQADTGHVNIGTDNFAGYQLTVQGDDDELTANFGSALSLTSNYNGIGFGHATGPKAGIFFERQASYSVGRLKFCVNNTADGADVAHTDLAMVLNMDRTAQFYENVVIAATKNLYLDGGGNTYITESEADRLDLYAGGQVALSMYESANEVRSVFNYGTTAIWPAAGLGVRWVAANEYAATFWHNGNATTGLGVTINCGTDDASGTNTAMSFKDGDGTDQGSITFSGGTVSYNAFTAGHDASLPDGEETGYAYGTLVEIVEIYYKERKDGSEMERGILYKVQKSQSAYAKNVLGAYSGQYTESVVEDDNLHQIYCLGDGHIICNGENGDIEVGDGICTSSTEGEGMKADKLSMIIGIAQEDTSFSSASETKLVPVQYGLKQFQPWE